MDWSALLGALIGASAGIIGSFVSSWAQSRKDRLAFNRDKVIAAALQYLHDCDALFDAVKKTRGLVPGVWAVSNEVWVSAASAKETAKSSMTRLNLLCPKAGKETHALYLSACLIRDSNVIEDKGEDDVDAPKSDDDYGREVDKRYELAKSAFMKRIRKLADL